ncbi:hypothetical protein BC936DRAFT_149544 [Jimgerdemannia flammicorona]|uniref:Uncharacterized protein n=1 Tax=Jimgerdemannia flammicorona TaxID=994334 RepID=A0A433D0L7_9FUNG|nr:hypothetical protein BC936DRAFT_149544 [Jimgerdemannia flammicorona]
MDDIAIYNSCGGFIFVGKSSHLPVRHPSHPFHSQASMTRLNGISILANYPNVQERAFFEIKGNIGLDHLPRETDEERLPYTPVPSSPRSLGIGRHCG